MIQTVLFDLDNTLILKKPTLTEKIYELALMAQPDLKFEAVQKAYAASEIWQGEQIKKENETGVRMSDEEYLGNLIRIYKERLSFLPADDAQLEKILMQDYGKEYCLSPHAQETLQYLKSKGVTLGIVSNNYGKIRQVLADLEIADSFDTIIISEEVDLYKPDPKILEYACSQLNTPCDTAIYVGDHPFDILCAHSAGMPAVWMPENPFMTVPEEIGPAEYTISSLAELNTIL